MAISSLEFDELLGAFRWPEAAADGPYSLVLLGEDYAPIARVDGIAGSPWKPTGEVAVSLKPTVTYHAFVLGVVNQRTVKSPVVRFTWN
ncbi:MAG: hypothetical protein KAI24_08795 [Planctomycetes bacterium]|nr:hypothetical protein [Planctomycetota bacterium]